MEESGSLSTGKKKRGRPRKIKQVEEGKLESRSEDNRFPQTGSYSNESSWGPGSTQTDPLIVSRRQTRYSEALADKEAAFATPSRFPMQNAIMDVSENTSFSELLINADSVIRANDVLVEAFASRSPFQAPEQHSQHEHICGGDKLPETEATADRNLQTFDHLTGCPTCNMPKIPLVDRKSSENHDVISISQVENSFVIFDGYKVKEEIVRLLKAIFTKYGDIAKNSTFSMESRSCLLELVCSIYMKLEASKFMQLMPLELQSMLGQIGDLELVKVEVGWLHKRLLSISKARELCDNVSTLKEVEARTRQEIDEKKKLVETYEEELESCMAGVKKLQERIRQEKDELFAAMALVDEIKVFCGGSLVKGLF